MNDVAVFDDVVFAFETLHAFFSGGGKGTGAHSLGEAFDTTDSWRGTQRAILLAIALAR